MRERLVSSLCVYVCVRMETSLSLPPRALERKNVDAFGVRAQRRVRACVHANHMHTYVYTRVSARS